MNKMLVSMLMLTGVIVAQNPKVYVDMSQSWMKYDSNGIDDDFKPKASKWTVGYELKDFSFLSVALEGSAMLGFASDKKAVVHKNSGGTFTNAEVTLDKMYGLHLKGMFPLTETLNANVYVGASRARVRSTSDQSRSNSSLENSFSYGAGLEYWFPANVSLYANYMQYFKNLDAIEFGVGFRF